jgi:prevent-host-death family protein
MATWQVQTAKAKLSELLRAVREEGPQTISVRGKEEYVVVRKDEAAATLRMPHPEGAPKTLWELFEPLRQSGIGDELAESIETVLRETRGGVREDGAQFDRDE